MFFWNPLAFSVIQQMLAIWSLVPLRFLKSSLNIWKFMVHILLKPDLENFEHYFARVWGECSCAEVWAFFGTAFLRDWNENWPFPILWPLLSFPNLLAYWVHHHLTASSFRIWNSLTGIPSPPLGTYSLLDCFSLDICPAVGLQGHMVALFLVFWGTSILFSIVSVPIYIPANIVGGFPFIHTLSRIYRLWIFWW